MEDRKILIIEDEKPIADILKYSFEKEGFQVQCAHTGSEGFSAACSDPPDLILLDWMLPDISGVDVCRMLTERYRIPIIMLTARGNVEDKLYGLESGADDYIEKPYDIDIMLAKIRNIFKHRYSQDEITDGNLCLNKIRRTVYKDGLQIELTAKEFELLQLLMEQKGKALRKEYLFGKVWGMDSFSEPQTLTVHIRLLRQKIEEDPKRPKRIVTVWGIGYQFL